MACSRVDFTFTLCPVISSDVVTTREEFWVITLLLMVVALYRDMHAQ